MKAIVFYDKRTNTFTIFEHNVEDAEAEEEITSLRQEGIPAYLVQQPRQHRNEAATCPTCRRIIRDRVTNTNLKPRSPTGDKIS